MFSDLTFTVAAFPYQVQSYSASDTSAIPEYPTIKGIFYAKGAWIQLPETTVTINTDTVTLVIPKYQVAILFKKVDNLVDQGRNSYSMNALMLSSHKFLDHKISKPTENG